MYGKSQKNNLQLWNKNVKKIGLKFLSLYSSKGTDISSKKMNCYQFTSQINFSKDNLDVKSSD